ncbi:hypothetical protein [Actinophytocola sp.]|uniref:hypothetical protein n=1 Tax=Actinophytocola sp. TaxID=1872138 RepID=UPI002ED142E1
MFAAPLRPVLMFLATFDGMIRLRPAPVARLSGFSALPTPSPMIPPTPPVAAALPVRPKSKPSCSPICMLASWVAVSMMASSIASLPISTTPLLARLNARAMLPPAVRPMRLETIPVRRPAMARARPWARKPPAGPKAISAPYRATLAASSTMMLMRASRSESPYSFAPSPSVRMFSPTMRKLSGSFRSR